MEDDGTQFCFRCKGMAVINKASLERLPEILYEAAAVCYNELQDDLAEKLRQAGIMIEGMSDA